MALQEDEKTNKWKKQDICIGSTTACAFPGMISSYSKFIISFAEDEAGIVLAAPSLETVLSILCCRENVENSVAPEACLESRQCREVCGWLSTAGRAGLWLRKVSCPVRLLQTSLMESSGDKTSRETLLLLLVFCAISLTNINAVHFFIAPPHPHLSS